MFLCPRVFHYVAIVLGLAIAQVAMAAESSTEIAASAARIEADVRFLADDLLEGRETGTRGYDIAALYVATQYRQMGLQPAGDDGTYFQAVNLLKAVRERDGTKLAITRAGVTTEFRFEDEFLPGNKFDDSGSCSVTAPMVFVGQAIVAPELGQDDFAGVKVRGKVAVMLPDAPARLSNDQRAYYSDFDNKLRELERRGAVGVIIARDPGNESRYPWQKIAANWSRPGMVLVDPDGKPINTFPGVRCVAQVTVTQVDRLFAGARDDAKTVFAHMKKGRLRAFDLPGTATMTARSKLEVVTSHNVVGRLASGSGASPAPGEYVVLSAHLDHLGIGAPVHGDAIYNGAQDNAVGVAQMLEAGRLLARDQAMLKRSILLVATTAEEKGLYGAEYFAAHPTVPASAMVANVNLDMPTPLAPVTDLIPIGVEHSTLAAVVAKALADAGLTLTPDPWPEEVDFIRSDQYAFVKAGVPAVFLVAGIHRADGQDGRAAMADWMREHYHQPSDDVARTIDWLGAARLAIVDRNIAYAIATQDVRPAWNAGDFFGDRFGNRAKP